MSKIRVEQWKQPGRTYFFIRCIISSRAVFSIDFIMTRDLGVIGELASLRGLKERRAFKMRLVVPGRVRANIERQFNVASTTMASLHSY